MHTYSVRAQARGPTHNRCIAQTVHAKHCRSTSTVRTYKHKHSCTLRTLPRLSIPYTVHVHVQRARPSTRAYAQSVYRLGCPCQTLCTNMCSAYTQACGFSYIRRIAQTVHAECRTRTHTRTHDEWYKARAAHSGVVHTRIHVQHSLLGLPKPDTVPHAHTSYRMHTRVKCSAQAPV